MVDASTFKKVLARNVAFPLFLMALLCAIFVGLVMNMIRANDDLVRSSVHLDTIATTYRRIVDSETGLRGFLIQGEDLYLEPFENAGRELPRLFNQLRTQAADSGDHLARIERIASTYENWRGFAMEAIGERSQLGKPYLGNFPKRKEQMDRLREDLREARVVSERQRDLRNESAAARTRITVLVIVLISAIFGGLIAYLGRRQLMTLSQRFESTLKEQNEQAEELTRQAWIREGQMQLVAKLRGELAPSRIAREILHFVSEYLGAKVGAVFVPGENGVLNRMGALALPSDAPERFARGEGLVGRVAEQMKILELEDLPVDYLRLTSGIGETPPRHVVLAPFTADGTLEGILELGFSEAPLRKHIDFLAGLQEVAGVSLRSASFRVRLQDLLHESQQLTEELQTQQEELRVSNEELAERTNALQESQARMETQQAELEQTNEQLEEQAQILESQRSDLDERNSALESARTNLERKAQELELAGKYKSEFMANMSHELRTPLNSSLILAKLLQDNAQGNLTEEQVHFASTIYEAGNDLLNLINDILDLSKVEAGKLEIHPEPLSVPKVVHGLENLFRPTADERRVGFEVKIDPTAASIVTDRQRLDQILRNLLSNAFKFTTQGSVTFVARSSEDGGIVFEVTDTGIGIDPAQHDRIFEAFHQADGTISRKFGGTGLGLSISRSLTRLLGGTLTLRSTVGKGSTFSLHLPRTPAEAIRAPEAAAAARPYEGRSLGQNLPKSPGPADRDGKVPVEWKDLMDDRESIGAGDKRVLLVVEDEREFAKILLDLGHELGFKVLLAATTSAGYELALAHDPSAIILDIKLPDASGLTLLNQLKDNPKTRHIPVHGVSSTDYTRTAMQLGAVGHLVKPVNREELKLALGKLEAKAKQRTKRVLIVEDDTVQRESIEKLIGGNGIELLGVDTGESAMKALRSSTFDCMIVDMKLPDMSGLELLESMAEAQLTSQPPVIVYTGRDLSRSEEDRLQLFSKSIIIKGARSPERLLDEVSVFLHRNESSMNPDAQKMLRTSRNRERSFDSRTIMIVDDDVRNIFALRSALETKGAKTLIARNGREALERLQDLPKDAARPDLVLMDIMMPEMDGYETIRRIREDPSHAEIPIIAVTAKAMRDDYERCLQAGANDYLAKPIDLDKLISLMRVWLPREIGGMRS